MARRRWAAWAAEACTDVAINGHHRDAPRAHRRARRTCAARRAGGRGADRQGLGGAQGSRGEAHRGADARGLDLHRGLVDSAYCRAGRRISTMSRLMRIGSWLQRHLCAGAALVLLAAPAHAQTIDDGVMVAGRELLTGNSYTFDTWDEYWEGALKRTNANIGTITTKVNAWHANYGLADRLNVIGMVPYVWTRPSQGYLHGIQGLQDLTLGLKWKAIERSSPSVGSFGAFAVVSAGIPLTDYNPELLPLSIGLGSTRVSWRGTVNYQMPSGWFVNESA